MQVESIMSKNVHTVSLSTTLAELRNIFASVEYHHLLVVEDNQLLGVISDRDVLRRSSPALDEDDDGNLPAPDAELLKQTADTFMTKDLITVLPDTLIDTSAILLLEHNISCLPIVSEEGLVLGILTWKDMLKYYVYVR